MTGKLRLVVFLLELTREACTNSRLKHQSDNPMRCQFVSLSCKSKINNLIRLPSIPVVKLFKYAISEVFWNGETSVHSLRRHPSVGRCCGR